MIKFIIRRLFQGILTFLGVSILVFVLGRLTGDPLRLLLPETATTEMRENARIQLGLDRPIPIQYGDFLFRFVQGDLGRSYFYRQDVSDLVLSRLPATIELALVSMAFSVAISIPLGMFIAVNRNTGWDFFGSILALLGLATPNFWLGLMLIIVFGIELGWLPISGRGTPTQIILPAIALSGGTLGYLTRLMRSSMLDVLGQDYIRTARSKGAIERTILMRHGLKNALIPVVTMLGMQFGHVLSGAFIVETIFAWPGVGRLGVTALFERDFPVVQGVVLLSSTVFVLANLIVDVLYSVLDPRIRRE